MAKRRGRPPVRSRSAQAAETIGAALGGVMAKVDAWMAQREEIARELRQVADQMMSGESPYPWGRKKRPSPQAVSTMPAGADSELRIGRTARKKRTMSAEARAKISAAQKARWARQHAEGASAKKKAKKGRSGRI